MSIENPNISNPSPNICNPRFGSVQYRLTYTLLTKLGELAQKKTIPGLAVSLIAFVACPIFALLDAMYHLVYCVGKGVAGLINRARKIKTSEQQLKDCGEHAENLLRSLLDIVAATLLGVFQPATARQKICKDQNLKKLDEIALIV